MSKMLRNLIKNEILTITFVILSALSQRSAMKSCIEIIFNFSFNVIILNNYVLIVSINPFCYLILEIKLGG